MARIFSFGLIVALLLFVITVVTRAQINQTDGQKIYNRGNTRFHSKSSTEPSNFATTTKLSRDRNSRTEATSGTEKYSETYHMRESSIRTRSKLNVSRIVEQRSNNTVDTVSRTNISAANSNVNSSLNRPRKQMTYIPREEIAPDTRYEKENEPRKQKTTSETSISSTYAVLEKNNEHFDPEVFTNSPIHSRSRTGRKIYTNFNVKESGDQTSPSSRLFIETKAENTKSLNDELKQKKERLQSGNPEAIGNTALNKNVSRGIDTKSSFVNHQNPADERDVSLSKSENVRVDVSSTVGHDKNIVSRLSTSTTTDRSPRQSSKRVKEKTESNSIAQSTGKKRRQFNRSKIRNRINDTDIETTSSGTVARHRSSKFGSNIVISQTSDQVADIRNGSNVKTKNRSNGKYRGRSAQKSRDRAIQTNERNRKSNTGTNADGQTEIRHALSNDRRNIVEGKKRSNIDGRSTVAETRAEEPEADVRRQLKSRSRTVVSNPEAATLLENTTVPLPGETVTTTSSVFTTTKMPTTTRTISSIERNSRNREENSRSKKPAREDFFNRGLGFRGRQSSIVEITTTTTTSSSNIEDLQTTSTSDIQSHGNPGWTLKRRPYHVNYETSLSNSTSINREAINEIILSNVSSNGTTDLPLNSIITERTDTKNSKQRDENNIVSEITTAMKNISRGNKTFNRTENFGLPKIVQVEESDNYPPEFKAKLTQLQNINSKAAEEKTAGRKLQNAKSTTALFSVRSKLKLDSARRLIKPELNVDESNHFDLTTNPYFDLATEASFNENKNIEKITKSLDAYVTRGSLIENTGRNEEPDIRDRWKILQVRKPSKDRTFEISSRSPISTKGQITSEETVFTSSAEETSTRSATEFNAIPRGISVSHRTTVPVEEIIATKIRSSILPVENNIVATKTSIEKTKLYNQRATGTSDLMDTSTRSIANITEYAQEVTLSSTVTTPRSIFPAVKPEKVYPIYFPVIKNYTLLEEKTRSSNHRIKNSFRPRYTDKHSNKVAISMVTSKTLGPTSRYITKKSGVFTPYDSTRKPLTTEATLTQTKRREYRPRTATYRRHSETPAGVIQSTVTKEESAGVDITPKPTPRYHVDVQSSTSISRISSNEPLVNVKIDISNDTASSQISDNSNGNSGNSNIFNPTESAFLRGNGTILEQLRSTVAPLLSNLGNRTPIFSAAYSNVNNVNSASRITPNGSPPKFSARYKGAEFFVRKPSISQPMIPFITTSPNAFSTPTENSASRLPVEINSPGEPRFITFYQALESASIRNENLHVDDNSQQQRLIDGVTDDSNATLSNDVNNNNSNNDTGLRPAPTITSTYSPDIATGIITNQSDTLLVSRLDTENDTGNLSENISTTIQIPANVDSNKEIILPINNTNTTAITMKTSTIPDNVKLFEPINTEIPITISSIGDKANLNISTMTTSQNSETSSNISITMLFFPINESTTITELPLELTTMSPINSISEKINTIQQSGITTSQETGINDISNNDVETNIIEEFDATTISQSGEITRATELPATKEISNDIVEIPTTVEPTKTSTYRARLIDFAQDILSRLQVTLSTNAGPIEESIVSTVPSLTELSYTERESQSMNMKSRLEETTTIRETEFGNIEMMTSSPLNMELLADMITQNTIDSNTVSPIVQNQYNNQETGVRNTLYTRERLTDLVDEHNTLLNIKSTTTSDSNLENLSKNTTDAKAETTSITYPRDFLMENIQLSNDTLLTELMTIAKTLFTEAMNETQQLSFTLNQVTDIETTITSAVNKSIEVNDMIEKNEKNQIMSLNNTLQTVSTSSELVTTLKNISEEIIMPITLFVNETKTNFNQTPQISLMDFTTERIAIENQVDVGDVISVVSQMSLSQTKTQTLNMTTPVTASMNFELITNTPNLLTLNSSQSPNVAKKQITSINYSKQNQTTTLPNNNIELSEQLLNFTTNFTTNNPLVTNSVTVNTEKIPFDINESTTTDLSTETAPELTTSVDIVEINSVQTTAVDIITNQFSELTTTAPVIDRNISKFLETNTSIITTMFPMVFDNNITDTIDTNISQSFSENPSTESVINLVNSTDGITNKFQNITTNVPQTFTNLVNEIPNVIAHFQDTTSTAQGTAGSGIIQPAQTTETIIPTFSTTSILTNISIFPSSESSVTGTSSSNESTTDTTTTIPTSTPTMTLKTTSTTLINNTTAIPEMTTGTTIDINENLVSTEMSIDTSTVPSTTVIPTESEDLNMISRMDNEMTTTISTTPLANISTIIQTIQTIPDRATASPTFTSLGTLNTGSYVGRFGENRMTPVPRVDSSTRPSVRDYVIYGIYPNKTIVRKRPEDNLIDARNVDSPYVIFGIYPDGRLVRKFPNGTIIPDSPRNPVEVVFTLSTTTTTNRPTSRPYNQANQGIYNQYQAPTYYNNRRPMDKLMRIIQNADSIDLGPIGNTISIPPGGSPNFSGPLGIPGTVASTKKMNDMLSNMKMGTLSNTTSTIDTLQKPIINSIEGQNSTGTIIQDRDRSETSQTRTTSNQQNSVYIGQDKFINYQIDGTPSANPQVVDVKINSMATSINKGTLSTSASIPSLKNLLLNQSDSVITAPPGFPWRDPLDQIFGITIESPIRTASLASNQLDESTENNLLIMPRPINSFVEIFTPISNTANSKNFNGKLTDTSTTSSTSTTTAAIMNSSATTNPTTTSTSSTTTDFTTTATASSININPTTTTTTTTTSTTSTSTTPVPITKATTTTSTTTTTTSTTTTPATTTMNQITSTVPVHPLHPTTITINQTTSTTPASLRSVTDASPIITNIIPRATTGLDSLTPVQISTTPVDMLHSVQNKPSTVASTQSSKPQQGTFGTTFGDLVFLNSLLQNSDVKSTTPKTLTEVEQLLANRILTLALNRPGPTRSSKAIQNVDSSPNYMVDILSSSPSNPIIIDLLPYSSPLPPSWQSSFSSSTSKRKIEESTVASTQSSKIPSSIIITTAKVPVVITAKSKTTVRPRTTTTIVPQPDTRLGVSLWRALFGGNPFGSTTTENSVTKNARQKSTIKTTPRTVPITGKSVGVTQKPLQIIKSTTQASPTTSTTTARSHVTPRNINTTDISVPVTKPSTDSSISASVQTPSSILSTHQTLLNNPNPRLNDISTSTYSPEDDVKFLAALIRAVQTTPKSTSATLGEITEDDEAFLRNILNNRAAGISTTTTASTKMNSAALLALLLKEQGIEPSTPATKIREQLQRQADLNLNKQSSPPSIVTEPTKNTNIPSFISSTRTTVSTTKKPITSKPSSRPRIQPTTWSPSSTYPPPLFGSFSNSDSARGNGSGSGLISATRTFGQFLGAAISGAAQQLQSFIRNSSRNILTTV